MPTGKGFTDAERHEIDKAIRDAEHICRFEFSVYVGPSEGNAREYAKRLHATADAALKRFWEAHRESRHPEGSCRAKTHRLLQHPSRVVRSKPAQS